MSEMETMFGFGRLLRMVVGFGWPAVWTLTHVRAAAFDMAVAGSGFLPAGYQAGAPGGFPAPWEVGAAVCRVAGALTAAAMQVIML